MQRRRQATVVIALVIGLWAGTASAQALVDSFAPSDSQYWTGWVVYNSMLNSYTKYDDTLQWSEPVCGWAYFHVGTWPQNMDSLAIGYYEFYEYGDYHADFKWTNDLNPTSSTAEDLFKGLRTGADLGYRANDTGWLRFSNTDSTSWPERKANVLIGWQGDVASPAGVYGKAYGHTYNGVYKPRLYIYYH
jgi:hypothetical protein